MAPQHWGVFVKETMEFRYLTEAFYTRFSYCEEILTKEDRPYYVLILELDCLTYAIPLRSHITHPYCFIADNSANMNSMFLSSGNTSSENNLLPMFLHIKKNFAVVKKTRRFRFPLFADILPYNISTRNLGLIINEHPEELWRE